MRILAFSVLVATSLALLCPAYAEGTDTGLGFEAARLRGLHYKKVPSRKLSQEKASEYVLRLLDEELKPGPTLTKEVFLKELKLMPRKTTIKKILSKLYASQVRGIYDPAKKIFLVVDGVSDQSASAIAASLPAVLDVPLSPAASPATMVWRTEAQSEVAHAAQTLLDAMRNIDSETWRNELASAQMSSTMWARQLLVVFERLEREREQLRERVQQMTIDEANLSRAIEYGTPEHHY